jgi:hypothetical protein
VLGPLAEQRSHGIGDLLAAAIGDGDGEREGPVARGGRLDRPDGRQRPVGQELESAHGPDPHPQAVNPRVRRHLAQLGLDRRQDARDLVRRPAEVVGGEHPQRHRRDVELDAPLEEIVELARSEVVDLGGPGQPLGPGVATVAVQDDPDVTRPRLGADLPEQVALVEVIERPRQHAGDDRPRPSAYRRCP